MNRELVLPLTKLKSGQTGMIIELARGHNLKKRLEALGVRVGKKITKISGMFFHGPVTVKIDNTQIALGFGMSSKIFVEVTNEKDSLDR